MAFLKYKFERVSHKQGAPMKNEIVRHRCGLGLEIITPGSRCLPIAGGKYIWRKITKVALDSESYFTFSKNILQANFYAHTRQGSECSEHYLFIFCVQHI